MSVVIVVIYFPKREINNLLELCCHLVGREKTVIVKNVQILQIHYYIFILKVYISASPVT